jgi:hypothetical protein
MIEPSEPARSSTAGQLGNAQEGIDRSAAGLQFQRLSMDTVARGAQLGIGRRTVVDPSAQFSNPPLSGAQNGGGHAKSLATFSADVEPEDE